MKRLLLIPLVLLAGCVGDEFADLKTFMAQTGPKNVQPLAPMPPVKTLEVYEYTAADIPDPFQPRAMKTGKGSGLQPDVNRPKEPLEQYPLDGLRMVGTIIKDGQLYALVRTPDKTLYRIRKGEHMGQNFGLVIGISDTSIDIREIVQDGVGDWTESKAALALQE